VASVTLTTLLTRVRQRADAESSDFFTDALLTTFLNASLDELYELIATTFTGTYFYTKSTFTTVLNTDVALPADFFKLLGVDLNVDGTGRPMDLEPVNFKERNSYQENSVAGLTGAIHYIPVRAQLSSGSDAINFPNGWEEWAVVDAGIKCMVRQETDFQALQLAKQELTKRIMDAAESRDAGAPPSAVDVYDTNSAVWMLSTRAPRYRLLGTAPGAMRLYHPRDWV